MADREVVVRLVADASQLDRELAQLRGRPVRVQVDGDTSKLDADIRRQSGRDVRVDVVADKSSLAGLSRSLGGLGGAKVPVDVDTGQATGKVQAFAGALGQLGQLPGLGGLGSVGSSIEGLGVSAAGASSGLSSMVAAAGPAAVAVGAVAAAALIGKKGLDAFGQTASEVRKVAAVTGATAESASTLVDVFGDIGIGSDRLAGSLARLQKGAASGALAEFGITSADVNENLAALADRLAALPPGAERTALAVKALGRSGAELVPFLSQGSKAIEELRAQTNKGLILSDKDLQSARELSLAFDEIKDAVQGLLVTVGKALAPAVTELGAVFSELAPVLEPVGKILGGVIAFALKGIVQTARSLLLPFRLVADLIKGDMSGSLRIVKQLIQGVIDAVDVLLGPFVNFSDDVFNVKQDMDAAKASTDQLGVSVDGAAESADGLAGGMGEVKSQAELAAEAAQAVQDAISGAIDPVGGLIDAQQSVTDANQAVADIQKAVAGAALQKLDLAVVPSLPSDQITAIQQQLNTAGYKVKVDGTWGPESALALQALIGADPIEVPTKLEIEKSATDQIAAIASQLQAEVDAGQISFAEPIMQVEELTRRIDAVRQFNIAAGVDPASSTVFTQVEQRLLKIGGAAQVRLRLATGGAAPVDAQIAGLEAKLKRATAAAEAYRASRERLANGTATAAEAQANQEAMTTAAQARQQQALLDTAVAATRQKLAGLKQEAAKLSPAVGQSFAGTVQEANVKLAQLQQSAAAFKQKWADALSGAQGPEMRSKAQAQLALIEGDITALKGRIAASPAAKIPVEVQKPATTGDWLGLGSSKARVDADVSQIPGQISAAVAGVTPPTITPTVDSGPAETELGTLSSPTTATVTANADTSEAATELADITSRERIATITARAEIAEAVKALDKAAEERIATITARPNGLAEILADLAQIRDKQILIDVVSNGLSEIIDALSRITDKAITVTVNQVAGTTIPGARTGGRFGSGRLVEVAEAGAELFEGVSGMRLLLSGRQLFTTPEAGRIVPHAETMRRVPSMNRTVTNVNAAPTITVVSPHPRLAGLDVHRALLRERGIRR